MLLQHSVDHYGHTLDCVVCSGTHYARAQNNMGPLVAMHQSITNFHWYSACVIQYLIGALSICCSQVRENKLLTTSTVHRLRRAYHDEPKLKSKNELHKIKRTLKTAKLHIDFNDFNDFNEFNHLLQTLYDHHVQLDSGELRGSTGPICSIALLLCDLDHVMLSQSVLPRTSKCQWDGGALPFEVLALGATTYINDPVKNHLAELWQIYHAPERHICRFHLKQHGL